MEDKLQEKLEQELKDFKQEVKEKGVDLASEDRSIPTLLSLLRL